MNDCNDKKRWHENFHAIAIKWGGLVTRTQSGFALLRLDENEIAALSEMLDAQKLQLRKDLIENIQLFFQSEHGRASQLTTGCRQTLISHVSQFLIGQISSLQLSDASPEILHNWLNDPSLPSPSPNNCFNYPTSDSSFENEEGSVAPSAYKQKKVDHD